MSGLECVEISPSSTPDVSVIWMHGLGADGYDFESLVPELRLPSALMPRFVFPHAPMRSVTINGGLTMRAWYDILDLDNFQEEDERGILDSEELIRQLMDREVKSGIPAERIILAGFSQGGAMALYTALRYPKPLGGILALSTYLPLARSLSDDSNAVNKSIPIFMAHGRMDPVIRFSLGRQSKEYLIERGYDLTWREYPMEHCLCLDEVEDISEWIQATINNLRSYGEKKRIDENS